MDIREKIRNILSEELEVEGIGLSKGKKKTKNGPLLARFPANDYAYYGDEFDDGGDFGDMGGDGGGDGGGE